MKTTVKAVSTMGEASVQSTGYIWPFRTKMNTFEVHQQRAGGRRERRNLPPRRQQLLR